MPIKPVAELVAEAKAEISTLPLVEAESAKADSDTLFVDIRDVRELKRDGRIPGAMHAPRGMLEFWVDPESPYHKEELASGKRLVLYCASGWRSALAAKTLQDMGLENVCDLEKGFTGWRESGFPVDSD